MELCARHRDALVMALEVRGLLRPVLAGDGPGFDALAYATQAIGTHATNFAGRAAVAMLTGHHGQAHCPLCFINTKKLRVHGQGMPLTVDGWIEDAAEEAFDEDIVRQDGPPALKVVLGS